MIRVTLAAEPPSFNETVRLPGLRAIAEMVGEKPPRTSGKRYRRVAERREQIGWDQFPTYWTRALNDLMALYQEICAYSCFRIHPVTGSRSVDHFAPKSRSWDRVYEWENYRLVCSLMNARKNNFGELLDPFEVMDGWFQLELVGFQVRPNPELVDTNRERVQKTIDRLGLNEFRRYRAEDAERYWNGEVSLMILNRESPFVASELRRQGKLNARDR